VIAALAIALPLSVASCQQADAVILVEAAGEATATLLDAIKTAPSPQPLRRGVTITYSQHGDGHLAPGYRYLMFATINWETGQVEVHTEATYESQPTAQFRRVGPPAAPLSEDDDLQYGPESEVLGRLREAVAAGACASAAK
jgi:hypothetical protein